MKTHIYNFKWYFTLILISSCFYGFGQFNPVNENDPVLCADGIDNDGDGLIDCEDGDCTGLSNNSTNGCNRCGDGLSFADVTINFTPNPNCTPANSNPDAALGIPDYINTADTHFTLGEGGSLKLQFTNNILTNSGDDDANDLWVFEVGPAVEGSSIELRPANNHTTQILVNAGITDADGDGFYDMGSIGGSTAGLDIDDVVPGHLPGTLFFDAIDITDTPGSCSSGTPGADIDAVCALTSTTPCVLDDDEDGVNNCEDACPGFDDNENMDGDEFPDGCDDDIDGDGFANADDCDAMDATTGSESNWYQDADGDSFGDETVMLTACSQPEGYVAEAGDCDDADSNVYPGATEIPNDGIDQDCNGSDLTTGMTDSDGDGIADEADNCPTTANPGQEDGNGDGIGDACEACAAPYMVDIERTSPTTGTFTAGNSFWHYQGSANRAGRPLRPYPMYGMNDMEVPHTQQALVPQFEYDVWFRTICPEGGYSEWVGPFFLPTYSGMAARTQISLTPNPTRGHVQVALVETVLVEVYDMNGAKLMNINTVDNQFDISKLPVGAYHLKITDINGNEFNEQIIKQ